MTADTVTIRPPAISQPEPMRPADVAYAIEAVCSAAARLEQDLAARRQHADLARLGSRLEEAGRHCRDRIARWRGGGDVRYPQGEE